ncbi:Zinc metalloprotease [Komagataeibacter intermedius AF2]|uniref:Zinc metalloprotease n=1 Tax=Komagataeibacter intermedius AF2 TaxID=1458464 RepID=A0A0N1FA24_9PROT|nr:SprT family zinc-dependent metalloprotease [Komagataeibacter intermedius]KPH87745.1 Zinc metalloprotease [Komagataeibacter intermedius AF2]
MAKLPLSPIRTGGKPTRVSEHRLEIDGLSFEVHRSDRRKTMQITVERSGDLSIAAPSKVASEQLVDFVREKLLWIHTKIEEKSRLQQRAPSKLFVEGEGFLYLGKSYRLRLVDNQLVDLTLKNGRFCLRKNSVHRGREIFVAWYTRLAQQWFEKKVLEYSNRMGVVVKEVKVQDLGFRWGSFGAGGRFSFHWKAILLPPRIAQYVVVHELAHAHHSDHSARFWNKVEQHLPDWQWRKAWLAENGIQVEGL